MTKLKWPAKRLRDFLPLSQASSAAQREKCRSFTPLHEAFSKRAAICCRQTEASGTYTARMLYSRAHFGRRRGAFWWKVKPSRPNKPSPICHEHSPRCTPHLARLCCSRSACCRRNTKCKCGGHGRQLYGQFPVSPPGRSTGCHGGCQLEQRQWRVWKQRRLARLQWGFNDRFAVVHQRRGLRWHQRA